MKTLIIFCLLMSQAFAEYPDYGIKDVAITRRDLHFIATQNRALVGLRFQSSTDAGKLYLFEQIQMVPEYAELFPARTFTTFKRSMDIASKSMPSVNVPSNLSDEEMVKEAFYLKRLLRDMGVRIDTFKKSLDQVQADDYKNNTGHLEEMARKVCDHSGLLGSACEKVKKDVMELVNPYRDIDKSNTLVFSSSIHLISTIIPDRNFEKNNTFIALSKMKNVKALDPKLTLFENLSRRFPFLSNLEVIRLINVADTNYGASFFAINAAIDLSPDLESAQMHVTNIRKGIVQLYVLFEKHLEESRKAGTKKVHTLTRQYHYWAGTWIACELMEKGYSGFVAQYISASIGVAYEALTGGKRVFQQVQKDREDGFKLKNYEKFWTYDNSVDDAGMHVLGAELGRQLCHE